MWGIYLALSLLTGLRRDKHRGCLHVVSRCVRLSQRWVRRRKNEIPVIPAFDLHLIAPHGTTQLICQGVELIALCPLAGVADALVSIILFNVASF